LVEITLNIKNVGPCDGQISKSQKWQDVALMNLLDQVSDKIGKKHYSIRTEQAYVVWIKRSII
jgi:hypothetical protein